MAPSLRPMADIGVATAVMALTGVETSVTRCDRTLLVCKCSGGDRAFNCCPGFGALLGALFGV